MRTIAVRTMVLLAALMFSAGCGSFGRHAYRSWLGKQPLFVPNNPDISRRGSYRIHVRLIKGKNIRLPENRLGVTVLDTKTGRTLRVRAPSIRKDSLYLYGVCVTDAFWVGKLDVVVRSGELEGAVIHFIGDSISFRPTDVEEWSERHPPPKGQRRTETYPCLYQVPRTLGLRPEQVLRVEQLIFHRKP